MLGNIGSSADNKPFAALARRLQLLAKVSAFSRTNGDNCLKAELLNRFFQRQFLDRFYRSFFSLSLFLFFSFSKSFNELIPF